MSRTEGGATTWHITTPHQTTAVLCAGWLAGGSQHLLLLLLLLFSCEAYSEQQHPVSHPLNLPCWSSLPFPHPPAP